MNGGSSESRGGGRVRGFAAPPVGFDALSAPADVLSWHGVPRRPDPADEPYLAERWADVFGRPLSIAAAELVIDPVSQPAPSAPDFNVDGWAGVGRVIAPVVISSRTGRGGGVLNGGYEAPATFVAAQWEIPQVTGDPSNLDEFLSIWIGLDGFPAGDLSLVGEPPTSDQILRAGVMTTPSSGGFQWLAFTEWYSSDQGGVRATVTNLPVQSGDTVGIVVCVTRPRSATIFLANLSRNHGTSLEVSAPAQIIRSSGTTVEWIVEGGDPSISLPFSPVTFQGCVAGSSQEVFHLTPGDKLTDMFQVEDLAGRGPNVTSTIVTSPTTAVVEWIGAPAEFSE